MPPTRLYAAFLAPIQLKDMERTIPKNSSIWKLSNWQAVKEAAMDVLVDELYIDFGLELKDPIRKEALVEIKRSKKPVISTMGDNFTREIVEDLFSLTKMGLIDNLAFGTHLHSGEWTRRAKEEPVSRLGAEIVRRMAPRLQKLKPGSLKAAVETMFLKPKMIETVSELAKVSALHERNVMRRLHDAGFANSGTLVILARLVHAFPLLKDSDTLDITFEAIAKRLGWGSIKSFKGHWKEYLGMTPSMVKEECTEEEFLARVMLCLVKHRSRNHIPANLEGNPSLAGQLPDMP